MQDSITCKCQRCGYEWLPRVLGRPKACPECRRRDWDTESESLKSAGNKAKESNDGRTAGDVR